MKDLELKLVLRATDQGLVGAVQNAKTSTEDLNRTLDSAAKHTKAADKGHERLASSVKETGQQAGKAGDKVANLNRKLDKQGKQAKSSAKETQGFTTSLTSGAAKAGVWAAAITGAIAVAGGLAAALRTEAIRETQIMSETLGVSTAALSEWEYAAQSMNVSGEKVGDIFKDVSDKIGDFVTTGGGEAADLFENLNLKVGDLIDLSPDQQLEKIGAALDSVGNRGQKIFFLEALANDASKLLPLLENDATELKRLQLEAQVLGVSLSDIDAAKVTDASRAFDRVGGLAKGLANDLTIELAPILGGVSDLLVDAAIEAGGFRGAIGTAIDYGVTGLGYVLDYLQQLRVMLKYSELGWGYIGQAATSALASVANGAAKVINTVLYPFQKYISWVLDKFGYLIKLGAAFGGPFADNFKAASDAIKGFASRVDTFKVSSEDIISLNKAMTDTVAQTREELDQLLQEPANSDKLKNWLSDVQKRFEAQAQAQQKLGKASNRVTNTVVRNVKKQKDVYADLVKELEAELSLIKLGARERAIQIELRKLDSAATDEQKQKIAELAGTLYDYKAQLKENESAAKVWSDITDNAVQSVDDSFRELFRSGLRGWGDFWDQMKSTAKDMLAELAYTLAKEKLFVNVGFSVTGASGGAGFSPASLLSGGVKGLGSIADIFNPASGSITGFVNRQAYQLGLGSNPALANNVAAIKNGDFTGTLINPNGFAAQGLNSLGGALSAYGFAQKYGAAGGVIGGAGSAALAGGVSGLLSGGGFLSGATSALAGLGPIGWAGMAIGALLGGKKPSDKRQWAGITGEDNYAYAGGFEGKKFSQTNRDAASAMAAAIQKFNLALDQYSGRDFTDALQVQVGGRDGIHVFASNKTTTRGDLASPAGSDVMTGYDAIYSGGDAKAALEAAITYMAQKQGVLLDTYRELANENESLGDTYVRLKQQQHLLSSSLEGLGIPFDALGDDALRIADSLIQASGGMDAFVHANEFYYQHFYTEQERTQRLVTQYTGMLDGFNQQFDTAIDSRDDLREFVESLDLTTNAGQQAYAAAMQLAPALVGLANAASGAADSVEVVDDALHDISMTAEEIAGKAASAADAYLSAFGTEQQKFDALAKRAQSIANAYSVDLPATREDFRALIESVDWSTDAGQQLAADLADAVPVFAAYYEALEARSKSIYEERALAITESYDTELEAINRTHKVRLTTLEKERRIGQSLLDAYHSLKLSDLSPLTPEQRLQETQRQFAALEVRAEAGDLSAAAQLESAASAYLQEASSYYASGAQYQTLFGEVANTLNSLGGALSDDDRIAAAQSRIHSDQLRAQQNLLASSHKQLSVLAQSYTELSGVDEDTNALVELVRGLPEGIASALQRILPDGTVSSGGSDLPSGGSDLPSGGRNISDISIREHVSGLEAEGLSGLELERRIYHDAVQHGVGSKQLENAMGWDAGTVQDWISAHPDVVAAFGDLPQFAEGGHHSGGYAIVGERGPELAWFGGPAQIYTAEKTQSILSGDSLNALLQELAALRQEVSQLRAERSRDAVTAEQQREQQITRGRQKQRLEAIA